MKVQAGASGRSVNSGSDSPFDLRAEENDFRRSLSGELVKEGVGGGGSARRSRASSEQRKGQTGKNVRSRYQKEANAEPRRANAAFTQQHFFFKKCFWVPESRLFR